MSLSKFQNAFQPEGDPHNATVFGLTFEEEPVSEIPEEIGDYTNLREMYLSGHIFQRLPASFTALTGVTKLDISSNSVIGELPRQISALLSLKFLAIHGCPKIQDLPVWFTHLKNLEELQLVGDGHNDVTIRSVPEGIQQLPCWAKIQNIPFEIYRPSTPAPVFPNASSSAAAASASASSSSGKPNLGALTNLRELKIYGNPLSELPESITNLSKLTCLAISKPRPASQARSGTQNDVDNDKRPNLYFAPKGISNLPCFNQDANQFGNLKDLEFY